MSLFSIEASSLNPDGQANREDEHYQLTSDVYALEQHFDPSSLTQSRADLAKLRLKKDALP